MTEFSDVHTIHNLSEYLNLVREVPQNGKSWWYRGCGKSSYTLTPTLYRHPSATAIEALMKLETDIVDRFKERSLPYLSRNLHGDWEYLFLMQHYGVPTRLLDWTENPFFALLFAIISADHNWIDGNITYSDDASVWILDPVTWNRWALEHITFEGTIISVGDRNLDWYQPKPANLEVLPNEPLAIYGAHNSPRIVAQRGVFTIFGKSTDAMEDKQVPAKTLRKVILPSDSLSEILDELISMGITDASIFPDLEGLARELKRTFGYRVRV